MNDLTFSEYQKQSIQTKLYPNELAIPYVTIGLAGEVGEISEKVKKTIRDKSNNFTPEIRDSIASEIGDVLWYLAALADELGQDLGHIAQNNIAKLESRKNRGVLQGSGDNR